MVGAMSADQATQHPCQMKAPYSMAFPPAPVCSTEGEPLDRVHAAKKVSPRASRKRQARPIPLHTPIRTTTKERHRGTSRDASRNTLARSSRMMSSIERRPWHDSTRNARYAALRRTSAAIAKLETAPRNRQVNDQSVISVSRHARRWLPPDRSYRSCRRCTTARLALASKSPHTSFRFRKEAGPAGKSPAVRVSGERFAGFERCARQLAQLPRPWVETAGGGWTYLKSINPMPAIHRASSAGQMLSNRSA